MPDWFHEGATAWTPAKPAKPARKPRLTDAGAALLRNRVNGRHLYAHISGMSACGGATGTVAALRRHGWLTRDDEITDDGRAALADYDARQARRRR